MVQLSEVLESFSKVIKSRSVSWTLNDRSHSHHLKTFWFLLKHSESPLAPKITKLGRNPCKYWQHSLSFSYPFFFCFWPSQSVHPDRDRERRAPCRKSKGLWLILTKDYIPPARFQMIANKILYPALRTFVSQNFLTFSLIACVKARSDKKAEASSSFIGLILEGKRNVRKLLSNRQMPFGLQDLLFAKWWNLTIRMMMVIYWPF